jgi:hypothetical protein
VRCRPGGSVPAESDEVGMAPQVAVGLVLEYGGPPPVQSNSNSAAPRPKLARTWSTHREVDSCGRLSSWWSSASGV